MSEKNPRRILRSIGAVLAGVIALIATALPCAWIGGKLRADR